MKRSPATAILPSAPPRRWSLVGGVVAAFLLIVGVVLMHASPASSMTHPNGMAVMTQSSSTGHHSPGQTGHETGASAAVEGIDCLAGCDPDSMMSMGCSLAPSPTHTVPSPTEALLAQTARDSLSRQAASSSPGRSCARAPNLHLLSISRT